MAARRGLLELFLYDRNMNDSILRAATAKGYGLDSSPYASPYPGSVNVTLQEAAKPPIVPTPAPPPPAASSPPAPTAPVQAPPQPIVLEKVTWQTLPNGDAKEVANEVSHDMGATWSPAPIKGRVLPRSRKAS